MNLTSLQADLYDRLGYAATPATEVTRRLTRFINEAHQELLAKKWCSKYRRQLLTFSSIAGSPFVVLPQAASRILILVDRTNNFPLDETTLERLRFTDPGLRASSAYPDRYVVLNNAAAVARDPSTPLDLFLKSDDVADTQVAYIEGIVEGGYTRSAAVTLTGTTAVPLAASITTWIAVTKFYLSSVAVGNVKLMEASGSGTELARITSGRTYSRFTRLHLYATPTTALTYYADIDRLVFDLVNDNDEPLIPFDFHWLLTCGALQKEYSKREKEVLVQEQMSRWKQGVLDMQLYESQQSGVAHGLESRRRFSQLGSNFPPGS